MNDSYALEQLLLSIVRASKANGAVLLLKFGERLEVVAALREDEDLPKLLQDLTDRVRDGDGLRFGGDGTKHPG